MSELSYQCPCGAVHPFDTWTLAHLHVELNHECEKCGARNVLKDGRLISSSVRRKCERCDGNAGPTGLCTACFLSAGTECQLSRRREAFVSAGPSPSGQSVVMIPLEHPTGSRSLDAMKKPVYSPLKALLDKAEALLQCGAVTKKELGEAIMPDKAEASRMARISEWITTRKYPLSDADTVLRLNEFVCAQEDARPLPKGYTKALREITARP